MPRSSSTTTTALRSPRSKRRIHWFTWRHVRFKLIETANVFAPGQSQLELIAIAPRDTPIPITTTGYLAHYVDAAALAQFGGPVAFFTEWLDREARSKTYRTAEYRWRQGDLFDALSLDEDRDT